MKLLAAGLPAAFVRALLVACAAAFVGSCGSGAVSAPPATVTPGPIVVTPSTATVYSDLPTTFIITGGNGSYLVSSSDQQALPASGAFGGSELTLVPNPVVADTPVTLTVRDTGSTTPATSSVTVKPRTVSNVITVTPSASQAAACGTSVCAGGDAEVAVALAQGGLPLRNREVRFDVVSGEFRIITSPAGFAETLSTSGTTFTDNSGIARMRIRVLNDATSQTALLQITDLGSGSTQRTSFGIAPSSNAPLNAQPTTIAFRGNANGVCPTGLAADVIVFGGRPPYLISQPGTFLVSPTTLTRSGERFTVTARGQCTDGSPIAVVDANGASVTVTVSATTPAVITPPVAAALTVAPTSVTLDSCNAVATVTIAGGVGPPYIASSGHSSVRTSMDVNKVFISRAPGSTGTAGPVTVAISDGQTVKEVTVKLEANGTNTPAASTDGRSTCP